MSIGMTAEEMNKPKPMGRPKKLQMNPVDKNAKFKCNCGIYVKINNSNQHKKSNKHKMLVSAKNDAKNVQMAELKNELDEMNNRLKTINDLLIVGQFKLNFN